MAVTGSTADLGELLRLRTTDEWAVGDLVSLLTAVEKIYDAILAAEIAVRFTRRSDAAIAEAAKELGLWLEKTEGRSGSIYHWPPYLRLVWPPHLRLEEQEEEPTGEKGQRRLRFYGGSLASGGPSGTAAFALRYLRELAPEARLRLASIAIASPGEVNLTGSGEIIKETGDLVEKAVTLGQRRRRAKLENDRLEQQHAVAAQRDVLALAGEHMDFISRFLEIRFGPDWRQEPDALTLFDQAAQGAFGVEALAEAGKVVELSEHTG